MKISCRLHLESLTSDIAPSFLEALEVVSLAKENELTVLLTLGEVGDGNLAAAVSTLGTWLMEAQTVKIDLRIHRIHGFRTNRALRHG